MPELAETAPKIISFEIPVDKIGEVIGPKGKVINAIQGETGADISVDDDGLVGIVAIAAVDMGAVDEAERQIKLILDPPTADVGAVYQGRVVNITKFGAFVNILPGRDGLVHISKLGGGKRIDRVEDVLELGEEIEVTVDDIDPNGKISLDPPTDADPKAVRAAARRRRPIAATPAPAADGRAVRATAVGPERRRAAASAESFDDASWRRPYGELRSEPTASSGRTAPAPVAVAVAAVATVAAAVVAAAVEVAAADDRGFRSTGDGSAVTGRPTSAAPSCPTGCGSSPTSNPIGVVGLGGRLGRCRLPRRTRRAAGAHRTSSNTCCSRGPTRATPFDRGGHRRRRRRDERLHRQRAHRLLRRCARRGRTESRSTCSSTWSAVRRWPTGRSTPSAR